MHFADSGLAATLAGLTEDWSANRRQAGRIRTCASGTTHKDQVEVDLVITRGRQTWGVEVKSAMTALPGDGRGLRRLAEQCGRDFRGGVVLYAGESTFALPGSNLFAVPLARCWDR